MSVIAKKWILSKYFEGSPKLEDFKLVEEKLDKNIGNGEVLVEAVFLSVDPYMRNTPGSLTCPVYSTDTWDLDEEGFSENQSKITVNGQIQPMYKQLMEERKCDALVGTQIAKVIVSKSASFPVGSYVIGELGWRTHTVCDESKVKKLPEVGNLPKSTAMGVIGMPGMTAYFGVHDILKPKPGEVVVVSTAAGAVGSLVGQIAKLKGATVIGSAGSQKKLDWLTDELGFDHVFNYKTTKLEDALKKYAPDGVDCYFDNVGGEFATTMVKHLKTFGRMACCGSISTYGDEDNQPTGTCPWYYLVIKQLLVKGYFGWTEIKRWPEAQKEMLEWIQQGKVKYREHVTHGFDNMPTAFLELFLGENIGKAIVKV